MRGSRDGYFFLWLDLNKKYAEIVVSMENKRYDPRLPRIIRQMIATITDDSIRLFAWNMFDKTINQIRNDKSLKTEESKTDLIMDMCDILLGELWAYYDQFMGVTHRLRAGEATPPQGMEEDEESIGSIESPVGVPAPEDVIDD